MTVLRERIETSLPVERGVRVRRRLRQRRALGSRRRHAPCATNPGPVGVGARYRLGVRMGGRVAPMDYEVTAFEPPAGSCCSGAGRGVEAWTRSGSPRPPTGTRIDYIADIRLVGLLRLVGAVRGGALARVGRTAREGMERALERRATGA